MPPTRRAILASTAAAVSLAGCVGDGGGAYGGDGGNDGADTDTTTRGTTATTGATTTASTPPETTTPPTETTTPPTETTTMPPETTTMPPGPGVGETVEMRNVAFHPVEASVEPGTTVEWVNEDDFAHDVTSATFHDSATRWNFSEQLAAGESTTYTFEDPGVYKYYCTIHGQGSMCGVVLVGEATLEASLPCQGGGQTTTTTDDGYY